MTSPSEPPSVPLVQQSTSRNENEFLQVAKPQVLSQCSITSQDQKKSKKIGKRNVSQNEEHLNVLRILLLFQNGEKKFLTLDVPREGWTIEWMLQQAGVLFASHSVQIVETNTNGVNYIVTVGDVKGFSLDVPVIESFTQNYMELLPDADLPPSSETGPKQLIPSNFPQKVIEAKFAVCTNCGYLSMDFNTCLKCGHTMAENVKYVVGKSTAIKRKRKDNVKYIPIVGSKDKKQKPATLVMKTNHKLENQKTPISTKKILSEKVLDNKLNAILGDVKLPCKFKSKGCDVEMTYGNLEDHQNKCIFQTVNCLLWKENCKWKGQLINILTHFQEAHSKHIISNSRNTFSLEINPSKITNLTKIIRYKSRAYILTINKLKESGNLQHLVRHIKPTSQDLEMIIKYNGNNGQHKVKTKCLPFESGVINNKIGTKIRLITLNEIADKNGTLTLTIKPDTGETTNEQVLKHLECPVCKELMRPPIHQCSTGHSFCDNCRPKLIECPTCRRRWSNTRNFSLEGLTASVKYSCVYTQYGCEAAISGNEINKHEKFCEFKVTPCPISDCDFMGKYFAVKNHFKQHHVDYLVESTKYEDNFMQTYYFNSAEIVKYIFEHCNIYKLTFKRARETCTWTVRILNSFNVNNKYFYVISVADPQKEQRKMTKSNLCLNADGNATDNSVVSFSYNELCSYKNVNDNDQIAYCCEIFELKSVA